MSRRPSLIDPRRPRWLAVILVIFGLVRSAPAQEPSTFLIRTGQHESFVRLVVETQTKLDFALALDPDGAGATVQLSGSPATEPKIKNSADVIASIDPVPGVDGNTAIKVAFRRPVSIKSQTKMAPEGAGGHRIVVDFAFGPGAVEAKPRASEAPAPPPVAAAKPPDIAPPTPNGESVFILSGFRTARFGSSVAEVVKAIEKDFKIPRERVTDEIDTATRARRLTATADALLPGTHQARLRYLFGPGGERLVAIELSWGCGATGVSEAEDRAITEPLTRLFRKIDYPADRITLNRAEADGATLVFEGRDVGDRASSLRRRPLPAVGGEPRSCLVLSYRTPEAGT